MNLIQKNLKPIKKNSLSEDFKLEEILNQPTQRDKYEDLLGKSKKPVMPVHYKLLFNHMIALDSSLIFFKNRAKLPFFDDLKSSIEITTRKTFDFVHFKQILAVNQSLYKYSYSKSKGQSLYQLKIEPMEALTEISMKKRKAQFESDLMKITNTHYERFLSTLDEPYKSCKLSKSWLHLFDPHDVHHAKVICPLKIDEKPLKSRGVSVTDYLRNTKHIDQKASSNFL